MALDIRHPPEEWERLTGVHIIDDDGWRGQHQQDWDEPITKEEFLDRASFSTAEYPPKFFDQFR
jgi:hypothetical protein